jgi:chromosome segregation and condensation protein ScpB
LLSENNQQDRGDKLPNSMSNRIAIQLKEKLEHNEFKRTIEAVLFEARRPVSIQEMRKIFPSTRKKAIRKAIYEIQEEYNLFNTILKIVEYSEERFELLPKREIVNAIDNFTLGDLFNPLEIKTLAYVIYNHPNALKRDLAFKLGKSMYKHIKNLKKKGFIEEKNGKIFLSTYFFDYFELIDCSVENLKSKLISLLSGN